MNRRVALFTLLVLSAYAGLAAPGCTSGIGLSAPRAMNHPVDVAFVCFDTSVVGTPMLRRLSDCQLYVDVSTNTRQPPLNSALHMHALVTQSTRGEVGAVDLIARAELDSDMSVPGYTFVAVGELPTQIIVPEDPTCTYVASRGPVDGRRAGISIVDTRRFRSGAGLDHDPFPLYPPYTLPSPPSDMVLAPDQSAFWVTMDALGVLVRIPIMGACELGPIDLVVPLFEDVIDGVEPGSTVDLTRQCTLTTDPITPANVHPRNPPYDPEEVPQPVAITIDAENGLLLVADRGLPLIHRVNIADGTLATPLYTGAPVRDVVVTPRVPDSYTLVQGPGTTFLPEPTTTFSRYVYAIDDTDGTVMAIEYSTPGAPGFGAVLPVDVQGARRPDRIAMPIVARHLEIITPQYDTRAAATCTTLGCTTGSDPRFPPPDADQVGNRNGYGLCLPSALAPVVAPSPFVIRGVFLTVTGTDGSVRFVEIYDLDAPCRGRAFGGVVVDDRHPSLDCTAPTVIGDIAVYIRRHRPRVQQLLTQFVEVDIGPTVYFQGGGSVVLGDDGAPANQPAMTMIDDATSVPSLLLLGEDADHHPVVTPCPTPLGMVWGRSVMNAMNHRDSQPIVCSMIDPFAQIPETWSAVYEGTIPGTFTSSANALGPSTGFTGTIDTRLDYCALGVIGSTQSEAAINGDGTLPAGAPELNYHGDMLAITTVMPDAALSSGFGSALCRQVVGITNVGEQQLPILVHIQQAFSRPTGQPEPYTGRLIVDPNASLEARSPSATGVSCSSTARCPGVDQCDLPSGSCLHIPTIAEAIACFGDTLLTVDVRSRGAFTVSGTRSGYVSRVVRDPTSGACQYDDPMDLQPLRQGHAYNNILYHNARLAFRPTGARIRNLANQRAEIRMFLTGGPSQLGLDLSQSVSGTRSMALPSGLVYSPEMWALYAIETERRGLVEMTLRPLAVTQTAYY